MLEEDKFVNEIWDKYESYNRSRNKDKFFSQHYYKNTDYILTLKTLSTFIVVILVTVGMVYAGVTTYNYIYKNTTTDFKKNAEYDYNQDMTYQNGFYYKKVTNYDEYINCTKRWDNLVEMKKDDFKEYFVIITAVENTSMLGLNVANVNFDNTTLYIEFDDEQNENYNKENTITSIKIPLDSDRNNIVLRKLEKKPNATEYTKLEDLPKNYPKEQAIKDNCFVTENNKIISFNENQLEDFVKNAEKGINSYIRIVNYFDSQLIIRDIEYKDGKFIEAEDNSRTKDNPGKIYYNKGNTIITSTNSLGTTYRLKDETTNRTVIFCIVKYD